MQTSDLFAKLLRTKNLSRFVQENEGALSLPAYLAALCDRRQTTPGQVIKSADMDVSFGHQIFKGIRRPSRDKVIQLAFGFGPDVGETQELLKHARFSSLYPKVKRDAVLIFCINSGLSFFDAQLALYELGIPTLGRDL